MRHLALLRRSRKARYLHPEEWPEPTGKPRVLIENPDGADLWAHADILREAGYDVATCHGPSKPAERGRRSGYFEDPEQRQPAGERSLCPLVEDGRCPLVEGADVVVSTTALTDSREILATLSTSKSTALVVEGTQRQLEHDRDVTGDAVVVEGPMTEEGLRAAVEQALARS
jgi:hypothetical protein